MNSLFLNNSVHALATVSASSTHAVVSASQSCMRSRRVSVGFIAPHSVVEAKTGRADDRESGSPENPHGMSIGCHGGDGGRLALACCSPFAHRLHHRTMGSSSVQRDLQKTATIRTQMGHLEIANAGKRKTHVTVLTAVCHTAARNESPKSQLTIPRFRTKTQVPMAVRQSLTRATSMQAVRMFIGQLAQGNIQTSEQSAKKKTGDGPKPCQFQRIGRARPKSVRAPKQEAF